MDFAKNSANPPTNQLFFWRKYFCKIDMIFLLRMCQFSVDRATFLRYTYFCICDVRGSIAQLGEHLPYKQGVTGSSPVVPTIKVAR